MTPLGWAALAAGMAVVPLPSAAVGRAARLAERGRLLGGTCERAARRRPRPEVLAVAMSVVVSIGVTMWGGLVLGAAAAILAATVARAVLVALRARAARRRESDLRSAVRLMAAELDAGGQPAAAYTAAAAGAPAYRTEFEHAAEACRRGDEPSLAAAELAGLAHAWHLAAVTGAPLAAVMDRVAGDLSSRADQRRAVGGAVAGAQSSAYLLAVLPVLGLLLGAAMQARPLHVLFDTASGRLLCLVGVILDSAGVLWTARLTASAGRT